VLAAEIAAEDGDDLGANAEPMGAGFGRDEGPGDRRVFGVWRRGAGEAAGRSFTWGELGRPGTTGEDGGFEDGLGEVLTFGLGEGCGGGIGMRLASGRREGEVGDFGDDVGDEGAGLRDGRGC
jgi:hypothetical protein